jgi:hypothetical protein
VPEIIKGRKGGGFFKADRINEFSSRGKNIPEATEKTKTLCVFFWFQDT